MTAPRTVLVITGAVGAGHHAAAQAVEEAASRRWPDARVVTSDVLAGMGRGVGPAFAGIFTASLRWAGWLYELHFQLLWRVSFYRAGTRAVLGRWSARGLERLLERERPDLVVTTFPEAVAGLGYLRRRGRLPVPSAVLVADVAPHPMWCDASLDAHLVATDGAVALVERAALGATARVVGPPVVSAFRPPAPSPPALSPPALSPPALGPARERPLAMVSCGSLAFGDVAAVCARVLDADVDAEVTCARRPELRRRLERLAAEHRHGDRLRVSEWFDDPAETTRRADLVVTTGASATAHETIACARPLVIVTPIPGHGRAGARLLARAGLARVCGLSGLERAVREASRVTVAGLPPGDRLGDALAAVVSAGAGVETRVRGEDALFLHAATERTPQQLGARLLLHDPSRRDWPAQLATLVADRAGDIELLARALAPPRRGRPMVWRHVVPVPAVHVRSEVLRWGPGAAFDDLDAATSAALAIRVDPVVAGWALQIVMGPDPDQVVVVAVAHHALGDGLAITDAVCRLLTEEEGPAPARSVVLATGDHRPLYRTKVPIAANARRVARAVAGIAGLAAAGPAGPCRLTGPSGAAPARHLSLTWDGARVRSAARACGVSTTVLVLAAVAEALSEELADGPTDGSATAPTDGSATAPTDGSAVVLRAMVPVTERTRAGSVSGAIGNRTAALPVGLPVGPMSPQERLSRVDAAFTTGAASARPAGSAAVLAMLGRLPWRLYARLGRRLYGRRFLHLLVSVMPGRRRRMHVVGAELREVHPVLPLADGVGWAVGAINWGRSMGVGITVDPALVSRPEHLRDRLDHALGVLEGGTSATGVDVTGPNRGGGGRIGIRG